MLSIDPSCRKLGWCLWRDGEPWRYGVIKPERGRGRKGRKSRKDWFRAAESVVEQLVEAMGLKVVDPVVIELPAVWLRRKKNRSAAAGGAIVKLSVLVGMVAGRLGLSGGRRVELVPVAKWKGQVKKPVTQRRIKRRYGIKIGDRCCYKEKADANTIDAIGIGDWFLRKRRK